MSDFIPKLGLGDGGKVLKTSIKTNVSDNKHEAVGRQFGVFHYKLQKSISIIVYFFTANLEVLAFFFLFCYDEGLTFETFGQYHQKLHRNSKDRKQT